MTSRLRAVLFIAAAPVSVPAYLLFMAGANILGAAFYIVIEASLSPILRRPVSLTRTLTALLAIPVLALAPPVTAVHLVIWLVRLVGRTLCQLGQWQCGVNSRAAGFAIGLVWTLVAFWVTTTCMNAAVGMGLIGRPIEGRDEFVEMVVRRRELSQLPKEMQERRTALIAELEEHREKSHPQWESLKEDLEDDSTMFHRLPETVARKLTGVAWYFMPAEFSDEGMDRSMLLLGPLLVAWLVLIRWPGTFTVFRAGWLRLGWFVLRTGAAGYAIFALTTWVPGTATSRFLFEDGISTGFRLASPALWIGLDPMEYVRAHWYLTNAACWLIIAGSVIAVWWVAWRVHPMIGWPRYYVAFLASRLLQRKRIAFFSVGAVTLCVAMMIIVISVMGGFVDSIRARAHGLIGDLVITGGLQGFPYYDEFISELGKMRDEKTGEPVLLQATPLISSYGVLQFPVTRKTNAVLIWGVKLDEYVRINDFGKDLFYQQRFGATTLGPTSQPAYGFTGDGAPVLPDDMDANYRRYLSSLSDEERAEELRKHHRVPGEEYPGPGEFKMAENEDLKPGYEGHALPGVIIGRDVIASRAPSGEYRRSRSYPIGEQCLLTVLPLTRTGDVSPEPPPKPSFRYIDDSRTGIHDIDSRNVYVDFEILQRLLSMEPQPLANAAGMAAARCSQINVKFRAPYGDDRQRLSELGLRVQALWDDFSRDRGIDAFESSMMSLVEVATWEEMQQSYISAIEKEKGLVVVMFGVISLVSVFLILVIFYMIVQEKTRDIGIIKCVGGSAEGVAAVFLAYGGAIGLVGSVLGSLLGTSFIDHINDVQEWLARMNPNWRVWSPETYSFDKIPSAWKWEELVWIGVLAILASIAGAAFPAIRAGKTWPVESLRYE